MRGIDYDRIRWLEGAEARDIFEHQPELQRGSLCEPMGDNECYEAGGQQHGVLLQLQPIV